MAELETSIVTDVFLPVALIIMMFGMGLSTPTRLFREVGARPKGLVLGLIGQLLILPLLAIGVVVLFDFTGMERDLAVGLLLLGALPGGATSNILSLLSRGDTALSIVLTAITSMGALLWTPFVVLASTRLLYGETVAVTLGFVDVMKLVLIVITIPVLLGLWAARAWPNFVARSERGFRIFGIIALAVIVAVAIYENRVGFWSNAALTVPAALLLNVGAMGAGYLLGRFTDGARQRTIVIEVGFQNGTFGILLATSQLDSATAALIPAFYSLVMFATGGLLARYWSNKPVPTPPDAVGTPRAANS